MRFTVSEPHAPFLTYLTVGILPSHIWQEISPVNATLTELNTKPIGSGPYQFEKLVKDSKGTVISYTLKRHDNYHDQAPYLNSVTFKFYPSADAAIDALRNHNVEGVGFIPPSLAADIIETQSGQMITANMTQYTAAFFNLENAILANEEVRRALALATDTEAIIDQALYGYGKPIDALIVSGLLGEYEGTEVTYDPEAARELLVSAGWTLPSTSSENVDASADESEETGDTSEEEDETVDQQNDPVGENEEDEQTSSEQTETEPANEVTAEEMATIREKNGTPLSLSIVTIDTVELRMVAQLLQAQWEDIGVSTTITVVDNNTLHNDSLKNRDYDILLSGELYRMDPDLYAFWHSSQSEYPGLNLSGYENSDVDEWIIQARTSTDPQERVELYTQIQQAILEDTPAVLLYQPQYTYFVADHLQGVELSSIVTPADRFSRVYDWYVKTRKVLGTDE